MKPLIKTLIFFSSISYTLSAYSYGLDESNITLWGEKKEYEVSINGKPFTITREKTETALISGSLQPMSPAEGVNTVGEQEVIKAIGKENTMLVDMRLNSDVQELGTIPSAVNIPFNTIQNNLNKFGCEEDFDGWDCSMATKNVYAFCNSNTCPQSPTGIRTLVSFNYPPNLIFYFRGGYQDWTINGLPIFFLGFDDLDF